jgi:indole-3-glycerol phosphate synthase
LLIAAVLDDDASLIDLDRLARRLNLDVLLEVRDEEERDRALRLGADLIGINNRDLKTQPEAPRAFVVDTERTRPLFENIPSHVTVVAESGLTRRDELDGLEAVGLDAALIGSALMGADDVAAKCREFAHRSDDDADRSQSDLAAFV